MSFETFQKQLRDWIRDPQRGLLINAEDQIGVNGESHKMPGATFVLSTGRVQQHYLTVWGLFADVLAFDQSIEQLTALARIVRRRHPFDALVSASAAGHHILNHLHAGLDKTGRRLQKCFLRPESLAGDGNGVQLTGKRVLLVTDVSATGSFLNRLADRVTAAGGAVAAALVIVAVREREDLPPTPLLNPQTGQSVPLHYLADYVIRPLADGEFDPALNETLDNGNLLRRLIADPRNSILLDAKKYRPNARCPAFELVSGRYQRKFVSVWGIFDKPWYFEDCMDELAIQAKRIRRESGLWYNAVVTCTATSRHLMEHLQARIEFGDDPVEVHYLGPYPYHTLRRNRLLDLSNKRVLILTDVVASSGLLSNMASAVERLGGDPRAALGVVGLTKTLDEASIAPVRFGAKTMSVFLSTTLCIQPIGRSSCDEIIPIDPGTVLPIEAPQANGFIPCFDLATSLKHFEDSNALSFGFYEAAQRYFTAAFRIRRLLDHCGKQIWAKIRKKFRDGTIVVTTFSREDMELHEYVETWAARSSVRIDTIFVARYDSIDSDFPFFLTAANREKIAGNRIVLLLSSLQTSEKLRKLGSLLAQSSAGDITVVCLLNRMGSRTLDFISRIQKLLRGVDASKGVRRFEFIHIYAINDLHGTGLIKAQQTVEALAADYRESTRNLGYKSLIESELRYFRTASLNSRYFENSLPQEVAKHDPRQVLLATADGEQTVTYRTRDGKLFLLFDHAVRTRDYRPLINAISGERYRPTLYQLYTILLSNLSYLRMVRQFGKLRKTMLKEIEKLRNERIRIETDLSLKGILTNSELVVAARQLIEDNVECETYLLFGLSLFSYLDQNDFDYTAYAFDVLTNGHDDPTGWGDLPLNFEAYYGNERVLWCVSMLLHFARRDHQRTQAESKFRPTVDSYVRFAKERASTADASEAWTRIKMAFDGLLTDFGAHDRRQKHEVIRFLSSLLIEPKETHNPIVKDLKRAWDYLRVFMFGVQESRDEVFADTKGILLNAAEEPGRLKRIIEDATYASALLEGVGEAASQLFRFHPISQEKAEHYLVESDRPGFRADAKELRLLLQGIRNRRAVSWSEVNRLGVLREKVEKALTSPTSVLICSLLWYMVPLVRRIETAMEKADAYLGTEVWGPHRDKVSHYREGEVLIDPILLKEVLENMMTNVRHGFGPLPAGQLTSQLVDCEYVEPDGATAVNPDVLQYVCFRVFSPTSEHHDVGGTTFESQRYSVMQFGGSLEMRDVEDHTITELKLISRRAVIERWKRRSRERGTHA